MSDVLVKHNGEIFKCIGYDEVDFLLFVGGTSLEYDGWPLMSHNIPTSKDWVLCTEVSDYFDKPVWWLPRHTGEFILTSPLQNIYD